ncbi:metallocarboxypeptidase inhibitor [Solanum pennellii]|uniref:Metallocarboxypeptidase inhibitor n=1 Tax=Solanum pennellii TaxID=28526 RepID=A0ABM1H5Q6_SOLPN|nr:metallocarboxypeptidase inhibitor [Solanum pennellii]
MAQKFTILFTILLVVIAAQDVMAQDATVMKLFQQYDPVCNKPCSTQDDCSGGTFCEACWRFAGTCGPYVGRDMAIGV